jgi:tetratricopeptide (TPR) repeat protein
MCVMTDDLYERYKEALRTGHVSVLRGSLDEALAAYKLAAEIAPSRALPHTSLGGVYMRLGHLQDALTEFAAAVARSPHDEGALLGQAEALAAAGMRSEAAGALDHVAEIQEASGRLPEAADTLRRAVELEEAPERIRRQRALLREIRFSAGDHAAEQLLARALRLRDEPAPEAARTAAGSEVADRAVATTNAPSLALDGVIPGFGRPPAEPRRRVDAGEPAAAAAPVFENVPAAQAGPGPAIEPVMVEAVAFAPEPEPAAAEPSFASAAPAESAEPAPAAEPAPEPVFATAAPRALVFDERPAVGVMEGVEPLAILPGVANESAQQPSGDELLVAAEAAELAGDAANLRSLLLWTARAYAREGRFEAGLDATHRLLQKSPGDVDAHLVLVEIYVARSWNGLAAEKLRLLGRLAELNNDEGTRQRLCAAATRAFPDDPSLQHLCA